MVLQTELETHLKSGFTTVARCWGITRQDGSRFGFTDHDMDLTFEGVTFRADTGLTAVALEQSTGLSVDNTEAIGALSDISVKEADIEAGRFDGADVVCWLTNWADVTERSVLFRGSIGEIRRAAGAFQAELRGLTEALNRPLGRVYQKPCTAVLGDATCGFDPDSSGYFALLDIEQVKEARLFRWSGLNGFEPGWFTRGSLQVLSGAGERLTGVIKRDVFESSERVIELWEPLRANLQPGDQLRLNAGCDKRFATCELKFTNLLNFQGFPDIPGEDWMMSYPRQGGGTLWWESAVMEAIVSAARGWVGTPYRHQTACKGAGCDCLGLVLGIWSEVCGGLPENVPAYSMDWSEPQGDEQLWRAARRWLREKPVVDEAPGDVILFRMRAGSVAKHLGIAGRIGSEASFIHAYSGHAVAESPLSSPWRHKIVARFEFPTEGQAWRR